MDFQALFPRPAFPLLLLLMFACESTSEANRQLLIGKWELEKGFRNDKETESLSGAIFEFEDNGKMRTNLPLGIESPADYSIDEDVISQKGRQTIKYLIRSISDSALVLGLEMRGTEFEMHLRRKVLQDSSQSQ